MQRLRTTVLGREHALDLSGKLVGYWLVFLRLLAGWWFLYEGLEKYATPGQFRPGWFLEKTGTLVSPVLNPLAGGATEAAVAFAVPLGEVLIGVGLIAGAFTRTAAFFGAALLFFLYFGLEQWRRGLVNGELLGLVLFLSVVVFGAGRVLGVDAYLERTAFVADRPWIRYLLG